MKRNGIRVLFLLLCTLVLTSGSVFAVTPGEENIALLLSRLSIMQGYPDGELYLDRAVSRAEFAKITIAASPYKNRVSAGLSISPFPDVRYSHWAAPYVKLSVSNGLITGYPDSTFKPDNTVLLEEAVTVYLKLLGYTNEDFGYSWPYGQMGVADGIGLTDGIDVAVGSALSRGEVMLLTYNLLTCSPKNSTADYIESIQYKLVENVVLIATGSEDSSIASGRVATSAGTYKIDDSFSSANLGKEGDVILKNNDELVCFIPYTQNTEEYVIYSQLDNALVTYRNGSMGQLDVNAGTTVYKGAQKTTYGAVKAELSMGDLVTVQRDSKGNVDYLSIREGSFRGPVVVRSESWYQEFSLSGSATIMRDGVRCNLSDIRTYDVAYYSENLNMIMAYSKKVTGIYESASPNIDQPTSVTISGVAYQLESAEAFNALSSNGEYGYGDTVTVLIGKDGAIAGVAGSGAEVSSVVGFFSGAGVKTYQNQVGENYSSYYVTVIGTDGQTFEYAAKRDYSDSAALNQVVRVSFSGGVASISEYHRKEYLGKVDAAARTVGSRSFADTVRILDVVPSDGSAGGAYASVFLQRLEGITLNTGNVLYYATDGAGKITDLILNDVTGECYQYGVVTSASSRTSGMSVGGSYSYDMAGQSGSTSTSGTTYHVSAGQAAKFLVQNGRVQGINSLSRVSDKMKTVENGIAKTTGGSEYILSDKVVVYKKVSNDYTVIPVSELSFEAYSMTAYYDRLPEQGGRIRVIIAEPK